MHHRCAGEQVTLALLQQATAFLTRAVRYTVPDQDLSIPLARMPTHPTSGVVIRAVRRAADAPRPSPAATGLEDLHSEV
ncbi:MAG: hypothetical protein R3F59_30840 [Myxococcota bacterium]